ncbi:MAG: CBS domain-containing protein [Candidatus Anammoximicrobium sp.]|nr:CBS domain-containing protein [Candidatus Anammoximicrobium sp.]
MANRLFQRQVKDVMRKHVVTVNSQDTVHDALELMLENRVFSLPVVDHRGHCVGMLSSRDFVNMTHDLDEDLHDAAHESEVWWGAFIRKLSENIGEQSVMDLMTEEVISVSADDLLVHAARIMLSARVHRLPVLDGEKRLLGIVSATDVLRAFVDAAGRP